MPNIKRRKILAAAGALGAITGLGIARSARAQTYPARPIRLVVGFAVGGGADLIARPFAERMSKVLGQTVIVENKPGANGNIAAEYVLSGAPADGYTLLMVSSAMATNNRFLYKDSKINYEVDFAGVVGITNTPQTILVPSLLGVSTLMELVDYARRNPGKLNFASGGGGSLAHMLLELLKRDQKLDIVHIPYKGTGAAIQDMVTGRVQLMIDNYSQMKGHIDAGTIRALAVTGSDRLPAAPMVPTTIEAGFPNLVGIGWQSIMVPAKIPASALAVLRDASRKVMEDPEFTEYLLGRGSVPKYRSANELAATIKSESELWGGIIREANITL